MSKAYRGFWRLNRRKNSKARKSRVQSPLQLGHEALEGKRLLAVTATFTAGELLFTDDATGQTANTVSLYMGDATGSTVSYSINGGALTPQAGVTSIRFQDDAADAGDTLELFGFGSSAIAVSGTSMRFGGVLPITTASVENFLVEGGGPRAPVTLDDQSVTGDVTVRNALTTTIGATRAFELGGSLSIESLSVSLPGQIIAGGDVDIDSHDTSTLAGQITSRSGSVTIESLIGNLDLSANAFLITTLDPEAGDVTLRSHCGTVVVEQVCAAGDVTIEGELGVSVEQIVDGSTVSILAECGFASIAQLCVDGDVTIVAGLDITLGNVIASETGDIVIESTSGGVRFAGAAMLHAIVGSIDVTATTSVSGLGGSVTAVTVQSGGAFYEYASVTIAPPASGSGRAARASAVISPIVISPTGAITGGVITAINIDDPGFGYAPDEQIEVVIEGSPERTSTIIPGNSVLSPTPIDITIPAGDGAAAFAVAAVSGAIVAGQAVTIAAGFDIALDLPIDGELVTLVSECGAISVGFICADNDVLVAGSQGVTVGDEIKSENGTATLQSSAGPISAKDIYAGAGISLAAAQDIQLTGLSQASAGDIVAKSTSGKVAIGDDGSVHAVGGSISFEATAAAASIQNVVASRNLTIRANKDITLEGVVQAVTGDVVISGDGSVNNAARLSAGDSIAISAQLSVTSRGGGIVSLELLSGGSDYEFAIVTIAEPAAGGRAALARATVVNGSVTELELVDPGYGYAPGERVEVTIEGNVTQTNQAGGGGGIGNQTSGGTGAVAVATAGSSVSWLRAANDIVISAGASVDLTHEVVAASGTVSMSVEAGELGVSDLFAGKTIALKAAQTIDIAGVVRSEAGSVTVESTAGGLDVGGSVRAPGGSVDLTAVGEIVQRGGSVSPQRVFLLTGGRDYTYALVVIDPPPGAGEAALARAVITPYNPFLPEEGGFISEIVLLDGGWGYPSDSRINVRIEGDGEGAQVVVATDVVASAIEARDDISLSSGSGITLVSTVRSTGGSIELEAALGDVAVQSLTAGRTITVDAARGTATLVSVVATDAIGISAHRGVSVTDGVNSDVGDITIQTTNGDLTFVKKLDFGENYLVDDAATFISPEAVVATKAGAVTLTALNGSIVTPYVINAAEDVSLSSFGALDLTSDITSVGGDVFATSTSGLIRLRSNVVAEAGAVSIAAQTSLVQETVSGITRIELLSPGPVMDEPPDVTVTVAAPRNGGTPARAFAVIERRASGRSSGDNSNDNQDIVPYEYFIGAIAIIDAGSGYSVGEQPVVTITGVAGATARAYGPTAIQVVTAHNDIILSAGENVTLVTKIHSVEGNVSVASKAGDLDLSAGSLLLSAKVGAVNIDANHGSVKMQRIAGDAGVTVDALYGLQVLGSVHSGSGGISLATANGLANVRHLNARDDVRIASFQTATLGGEVASRLSNVIVQSTAGGVFLQANVVAGGAVSLDSETFIEQNHGTGLESVAVVDGGSVISTGGTATIPNVTVTIASPVGGGETATAAAIIGQRTLGRNAQSDEETVEFFIESILVTNPGSGYSLGEAPLVTIVGMPGSLAIGIGPTNLRNVTAGDGISIDAIDNIKLLNAFTALRGDVAIASISGDVILDGNAVNLNAIDGSVVIQAAAGAVSVRTASAEGDVTIAARDHVTVHGVLDAAMGDVDITSTAGNVDFTPPGALVFAGAGGVSLTSTSRSILNTPTLNVGGDINITSFNAVDLKNEITSSGGDITVRSTSGGINLAGNLNSHNDSVTLVAKAGIVQAGRGITTVTMLAGGSGYGAGTLVTIAPPSAGGTAARGRAIIGTVNGVAGVITGVQIITPGVGYAVGEEVNVTFTGAGTGASGFAVAGTTPQNILAGDDVTLLAGTGVKILNAVNATNGDIEIRTINGNLDFNSTEAILSAENGGVTLSSFNGSILSPPVLHVDGDIVMEAFTAIPVANQLTSDSGSIRVASSSGSVALNANVFAAERVELVGKTGISQPNGFIQADSLVVRNGSNTAVSLGNAFNNVNQLAATTLGSFSYTDADDFETGVTRSGPVGIEIRGDAVNLTALAPLSTVRVVSGLQYRSLSISAGAAFGANVGTVEYVVTSGGDSTAPNAAFQGSLRDMTRYLNDNTATYVLNGSRVPQKSAIVFDENGYLVEEIVVAGALPAMTKPVMFDGGRLEQTATVDRIGLRGTASTPTGLTFGLGSSGSALTKTAAYGFTNGSAIVMASGNNTVTDVHVGIDAAGLVRANRVGLDITGTAAVNNLIGSTTFDVDRVNRFAGNSLAGVLIRGGATGNRVFGNIVGDETGLAPDRGNGDGIRIANSAGNQIGTPEEVRPDLVGSVSNVIMGNRLAGIQVQNANGGTFAGANRIRNNYIANNATGVGIVASKFAVLGGTTTEAANTIVSQTGTGVVVSNSSNVRLVGNYIGLTPAGDIDSEALAGNGGDGVFVGNVSQAVEIMGGNRIGANRGHGVSIASGATGVVLTGNTIGGLLDDGTPAGNAFDGVAISAAIGNAVGAGNVVARNGRHGVSIADARATALTAGNRVAGSEIAANAGSGVFVSGGGYSTIGGAGAAANRINANGGSGVRMEVSPTTGAATGNLIQGNLIGADANRSVDPATGNVGNGISIVGGVGNVIANGNVIMNNRVNGVELLGGSGNVVGGAAAGQGNTITNNASNGVRVAAATGVAATSTTATGHVITGNTIANNARNGVMVGAGSGITVGQTVTATQATGSGNTIFGNLNHGVSIGAAAQQVAVQGNAIHGNALGAISRATGANRSATQTLSLTTATIQQTGTVSQPITVSGHLSNPSYGQQQYSVDIYASNPEDGNYGTLAGYQARRFLGRATVTTDAAGKATFTIRITTPIRVGEVITANATALRFEVGSSSAESNAVVVALQNIPVPGTPTPPPAPTPTPRPTPGRPTPRPAPRGR